MRTLLLRLMTGILAVAQAPAALAQSADSLLITNVRIAEREVQGEGRLINLLVKEGVLALVTEDAISITEAERSFDAEQGWLLGNLVVGAPPSFMIFEQNPHVNFSVLLDTLTQATFAIHEGVIQRNRLRPLISDDPEAEPRHSGWLAYTAPPMALPTSYRDQTRWNRFESSWASGLFLGVLALDRNAWLDQDSGSRALNGDLEAFESGEIRALRFGVVGALKFEQPWVYTLMVVSRSFDQGFDSEVDEDFTLYDYRLDIPVRRGTVLSVGKQKEPFSMERLIGLVFLPMQERAAVNDALLAARNLGVVLSNSSANQRTTWAGGAFRNWVDGDEDFDDTDLQLAGRATWVPFVSADESNLLHVGAGVRYSEAEQGLRYQTSPEIYNSPVFADTGQLVADDALTLGGELSWRKGPYWLAAEYFATDVDSGVLGNPDFSGYSVTASWALTGEMRPYNYKNGTLGLLPVASSVHQNGGGAWELALRYSSLDLDDAAVDGGELDIYSLGLTCWLTQVLNFGINYRYIEQEQFGIDASSHALNVRLLLLLE